MTTSWKSAFLELFSSGNEEAIAEAYLLKERHIPEYLYKFFPPKNYAFRSVEAGKVFLAPPFSFNDPFDSGLIADLKPWMFNRLRAERSEEVARLQEKGLSIDDLISLMAGTGDEGLAERLSKAAPEMERATIERYLEVMPRIIGDELDEIARTFQDVFQTRLKICCFSERANSMLLWAHYASQHKGFCVEYRVKDLSPNNLQRRFLFPVVYQGRRFQLKMPRDCNIKSLAIEQPMAAALHKAPEWAYEREWRVVNPEGGRTGRVVPFCAPAKVFAGARMLPRNERRLHAIGKRIGVDVVKASLHGERYDIVL